MNGECRILNGESELQRDKRRAKTVTESRGGMPATYRKLLTIRLFEERVQALFGEGKISGTCHLCIGQEAVAVGVCSALRPGDQIVSSHRGHGHLLAMGGEPARLLGELMGRQIGYCRGRGGSQHLSVPAIGFLGTNGITGGGMPIAAGAALSAQQRNTGASPRSGGCRCSMYARTTAMPCPRRSRTQSPAARF